VSAYNRDDALAYVVAALQQEMREIPTNVVRRVLDARVRLNTQDLVRVARETDAALEDVICLLRHRADYMRRTDHDDPVIGQLGSMWLYRKEAN
jgi:hypothetical protein